MTRLLPLVFLLICSSRSLETENLLNYGEILTRHCSPPFYYYKSWCYYVFPNITADWFSANRLCRSIDKQSSLVYLSNDDEMIDPLRDILVHREKSLNIQSVWTNTSWGSQRRTLFTRQSKRLCRKIQLKSTLKSGEINVLRMPFSNCRENHQVMCRKAMPKQTICRRPWALAYGICYYLDEQVRISTDEEQERHHLQCRAWDGDLFFSSKKEKTLLRPFLFYSLNGIQSSQLLTENFGGVSFKLEKIYEKQCSLVSGDVYLSAALSTFREKSGVCSSFQSYTFCRQTFNTSCQPPWFLDDGFCLYFSSEKILDMTAATIECAEQGGSLLYINNEQEMFRLIRNLLVLAPFFPRKSLAGVWLALSYKATKSIDSDNKISNDFEWQWNFNVHSYLDEPWKSTGWKRFFQSRLSPPIVGAGDCSILILDNQMREPIERTPCHNRRTVVCRKPFDDYQRSFHQQRQYEKFNRVQNFSQIIETPRISTNKTNSSSFSIEQVFVEYLNSSTQRAVLFSNGSSTSPVRFVLICQSKHFLLEATIRPTSVMTFDVPIESTRSEFRIFFDYFRQTNCTNDERCVFVPCETNDRWFYLLPEMNDRWQMRRQQISINGQCSAKYFNSIIDVQLCSLLLDQFRLTDQPVVSFDLSTKNVCETNGGRCVPQSLINVRSPPFYDRNLICPNSFVCWLQGETCAESSFCLDRLRFPCPRSLILSNVTCTNERHQCCQSSIPPSVSSLISKSESKLSSWNIFLSIYFFSISGTSKWDRFFFDSWLTRLDSSLSEDFVNDEFLHSCRAVFVEPTLLLTHQSCFPSSSVTFDKRSMLFTLIKKTNSLDSDTDQYDRVVLQIETHQVFSPFQLIRLAYRSDVLVNKTFKSLNTETLRKTSSDCLLVVDENEIQPIRLVDPFERQFIFDSTDGLFVFLNDSYSIDDDELWSFAPIVCLNVNDDFEWVVLGISGNQLQHECRRIHRRTYCQWTLISSAPVSNLEMKY